MPTYQAPGVFIEEISSGSKPIAGVGTSTAAFVGIAEKGVIGKAVLINNWSEYVREFGSFLPARYLAYAVYGFFAEGGSSCYVVRTCHYDAGKMEAKTSFVPIPDINYTDSSKTYSFGVKASSEGKWGDGLIVTFTKATEGNGFQITVYKDLVTNENKLENFDQLTIISAGDVINNTSKYIRIVTNASWGSFSGNDPKLSKASFAPIPDINYTASSKTYSFGVKASSEGKEGDKLIVSISKATSSAGFQIKVYKDSVKEENNLENFDDLDILSVEKVSSKYIQIETSWTGDDNQLVLSSKKEPQISPTGRTDIQLTGFYDSLQKLTNGDDGLQGLIAADFYGNEANQSGLHAFDVKDNINMVAIPDVPTGANDSICQTIISEGLSYCTKRTDCFFIADPPLGKSAMEIKTFKTFSSPFGYGALYYPWVVINDPSPGGTTKSVPPSGVVAGTYAYTDLKRGVHKAPAGITDGYLDSVIGVDDVVTKAEQEKLNPTGINVIRKLPTGIYVWGARTLSADPEWNYVNVRRLLIYIERSLYKGTQWVVFEPNSPSLWGDVKRNITAFLTKVWRDGALFGATPDQAFFVKIDAENNPPEERKNGNLKIDVGVAPVKPAEFVIIRISQSEVKTE